MIKYVIVIPGQRKGNLLYYFVFKISKKYVLVIQKRLNVGFILFDFPKKEKTFQLDLIFFR